MKNLLERKAIRNLAKAAVSHRAGGGLELKKRGRVCCDQVDLFETGEVGRKNP